MQKNIDYDFKYLIDKYYFLNLETFYKQKNHHILMAIFLISGVKDGTRTHDLQSHNLAF